MSLKTPPPSLVTRRLALAVPGLAVAHPAEPASLARHARAMSAMETNVVDHRIGSGHPCDACGPRVGLARVDAQTGDDVGPASARFDDCLEWASCPEGRCIIGQVDDGAGWIEPDQHGVGLEHERVTDVVPPEREVERAMFGNRFFDRGGVVGLAIAHDAQGADVDPGAAVGQVGNVRWHRGRQFRDLLRSNGGFDLP